MSASENGIVYMPATNGGTVNAPNGCEYVVLTPSGSLSTLTVVFPTAPNNADEFTIQSTQTIISLTVQSGNGGTVLHGFGTPALGTQTARSWVYSDGSVVGSPVKTWVPLT